MLIQEPLAKALLRRGRAHVLIAKQRTPRLDSESGAGNVSLSGSFYFPLSVTLELVQSKYQAVLRTYKYSQALRLSLIKVLIGRSWSASLSDRLSSSLISFDHNAAVNDHGLYVEHSQVLLIKKLIGLLRGVCVVLYATCKR